MVFLEFQRNFEIIQYNFWREPFCSFLNLRKNVLHTNYEAYLTLNFKVSFGIN